MKASFPCAVDPLALTISPQDYVYAVAPLLEDALMDRDPVHRQTAAWAIKHLALGLQVGDRHDLGQSFRGGVGVVLYLFHMAFI